MSQTLLLSRSHCHWRKRNAQNEDLLLLLQIHRKEWIGCEDLDGLEPLSRREITILGLL
jgi:hypothetical protein